MPNTFCAQLEGLVDRVPEPIDLGLHRSERFVLSVAAAGRAHKVVQVQFGRDGSIFVHFPYYRDAPGIAGRVVHPRGAVSSDISLEDQGKVTSQKVKYSHHPDGNAHFSQDDRVVTSVRNRAVSIGAASGHLFTVHARGLSDFADGAAGGKDRPDKRVTLTYDYGDTQPDEVKLAAHWMSLPELMTRTNGPFPLRYALAPDGRQHPMFLLTPPLDSPFGLYALAVVAEARVPLEPERESYLMFLGGFGLEGTLHSSIRKGALWLDGLAREDSFLALTYPVDNFDDLSRRIGCMDLARPKDDS